METVKLEKESGWSGEWLLDRVVLEDSPGDVIQPDLLNGKGQATCRSKGNTLEVTEKDGKEIGKGAKLKMLKGHQHVQCLWS